MKAIYHTIKKLEKMATKQGMTVSEYLVVHSEYKLSAREHQRLDSNILKEAGKIIKDMKEDS